MLVHSESFTLDRSIEFLTAGFLFCFALVASAGEPNPHDLLEGVIAQREQIPPSLFHFRRTDEEPRFKSVEEFLILSDGQRHLVLGTNRSDTYRAMSDGQVAIILQHGSVIVRDRDTDPLYRLFDPRILGLSLLYSGLYTPRYVLDPQRGNITCVGRDSIDGRPCWVVRRETESGPDDYWVDPDNNFAVYQYDEYLSKGRWYGRVRSFYQNPAYPLLPSRVVHEFFIPPGTTTVELLEARAVERIPPETWTLAGLLQGLTFTNPVTVTDVRKGVILGTWDGQRLIPYDAGTPRPTPPPISLRRLLVWLLLAGLVIIPLSLLWLRKHYFSGRSGGLPSSKV